MKVFLNEFPQLGGNVGNHVYRFTFLFCCNDERPYRRQISLIKLKTHPIDRNHRRDVREASSYCFRNVEAAQYLERCLPEKFIFVHSISPRKPATSTLSYITILADHCQI